MSSWRYDEHPKDFCHMLYGEDDTGESSTELSDEDLEVGDDEDEGHNRDLYYKPTYYCAPLSSLDRGGRPPQRMDETRDPLREAPPDDPVSSVERRERNSRMEEPLTHSASRDRSRSPVDFQPPYEFPPVDVILRVDNENEDDGEFLAPDAHNIYVSRPVDSTVAGRSGRRGERSMRGRGRGTRAARDRRGEHAWKVGHPLNEIWTTDADVPSELLLMVNDVMRKRQTSLQGPAHAGSEDEFYDADDGTDSLPELEGQNLKFNWHPMESFQGHEERFKPERTGSVCMYYSAYDAFRSYWDDDILSSIVEETNQYATKITSAAFQSEWSPTNMHEILCLFSFWMMLGIVRMPTITSCFSVDPLLKTEVFRRIFTRRRYEILTRALHFVESGPDSKPSTAFKALDPMYRLRPIINHLNSKFQSNYVLSKDICIDESLTLWKGRMDIKQYIRAKASKFGIKTFELCESATGYLWSFIVYTGKQSADLDLSPGVLKSAAIVKKLIGPLLNKGYRVFMDNWYTSPLLARFLKLNGTDCVGTLRPSRRDVPILINKAPLNRGEMIARHSGDMSVLSWQDKKRITMISTCHDASTALPTVASKPTTRRPIPYKPQVVLDYNKFMGGVDIRDQMLEPYLLERQRGAKWHMNLFKRLLNVSILNSRTLLHSCTGTHIDNMAFRLQLVDAILTNHLSHCPENRRFTVASSRSAHELPGRHVASTHWPILMQRTESCLSRNRKFWKRCVVCLQAGRKSQKTAYCCESCNVPLCVNNCFKSFHTQ